MAIVKKTLFAENLEKYNTLVTDTDPNSKYFKITELPDTLTGGKNAFLIQGSEYLVSDTLIKIEIKDSQGNVIYHEPGEGIVSASVGTESFVTEYYEGTSKVVAVYIYPDTTYGPATITILGEASSYENNGLDTPIPLDWEGKYNVKWQKQINVNPALPNLTKVRFYRRPVATITEVLSPIYAIVGTTKVASNVTQSFANIKVSQLDTFAGDVKRIKVFRTSNGDISDFDLIQDILLESKELLTTTKLTGSVIANSGFFTSEVVQKLWNTGSLNTSLTSARIDNGLKVSGSGYFRYTSSINLADTSVYELGFDAFYSGSSGSVLGIYVSGSQNGEKLIGSLTGISPTKNLKDQIIQFSLAKTEPSASLYLSQSNAEWHIGNISLQLTQDTAFSPSEISFVTSMPTVIGNETYNFKFEFYDVNNNYVPVAVTQSALFNGGNNNIGGTLIFISSSAASASADLAAASQSISGTMTVYSSSASGTIGVVSSSVSGTITSVSSSVSGTITTVSSSVSGTITTVSSSVSGTITTVSSSVSGTITTLSGSVSGSIFNLSGSVSTSVRNAKAEAFANVQKLANGDFPGTFIDSGSIYSPVIGGQLGYFSTLFKVGTAPSIYLDARQTPRKIFIGGLVNPLDTVYNEYSGAYNHPSSSVYFDSTGKFSLGDKLSWSGTTLSLTGVVNITSGATYDSIGAAATAASNASTAASNASTAASNAQTTANNANTAAGAAAAAAAAAEDKIFTDTAGKVVKAAAPSGKGLFLSSTHLGYYNTTDFPGSPWRTYMSSSGDFFLNGAGSNGLTWNAGTSALTIDGNITARNGTFIGNISSTATISGGTLSGGTITGGTITIGSGTSIFKADSNGIYLGNASITNAPFKVTPNGALTATGANIIGTVNATGGAIGGWTINGSQLIGSGSAGQIVLDPNTPAVKFLNTAGSTKLTIRTGQLSFLSGGGISFTINSVSVPYLNYGVGYNSFDVAGSNSTVYVGTAGNYFGTINASAFTDLYAGNTSLDFSGDFSVYVYADVYNSSNNYVSRFYLGSSNSYYYNGSFSSYGNSYVQSIYFPASGTYSIRPGYNIHYNISAGSVTFNGNSTGNINVNMSPELDFGEITEFGLQVASSADQFTKIQRGGGYALEAKGSIYIEAPSGQFSYVNGVLHPYVGNTNDLGSTGNRWRTVWTNNALNSTSDERLKNSIEDTDLGLEFVNKLRPVKYKNNSAISPRYHYGLIAQELIGTLNDFNKTTSDVGFVASSSLSYTEEDIEKWKQREDWQAWESEISASMRGELGLAYTELISPMIKAIQELSSKVAQLELMISGSV